MNLKRRRDRWALYRSRWVAKSSHVPHGYSVQDYVGSLDVDAEQVPEALRQKLSTAELADVDNRVCAPARAARFQREADASLRAQDPGWRLDKAVELIKEAAELSRSKRVQGARILAVQQAIADVKAQGSDGSRSAPSQSDLMQVALLAIRAAATAIREGALGSAPASGARTTRIYAMWAEIVAEVDGTANNSLLDALQARGFVKRRRG